MAKSFLIKTICKFLGKGLVYLKSRDRIANADFVSLPKNLKVGLEVLGEGRYLTFVKNENKLNLVKKDNLDCDLKVVFKNRKSAKRVMLGQIGVRDSFARHDILVFGNINVAVILVRLIERAESYLFPRFITKKFLPKIDKEFGSLKLYWFILFGNSSKINNSKPRFKSIIAKNEVKKVKAQAEINKNLQNERENNEKELENLVIDNDIPEHALEEIENNESLINNLESEGENE